MTADKLSRILLWKRPTSEWTLQGNEITQLSQLTWHSADPKPTGAELAQWEADFDAQDITSQQDVDREFEDKKAMKALVLWICDKTGIPPAQAKAEILAIYRTL